MPADPFFSVSFSSVCIQAADPMRSAYLDDLRSKFLLENSILKMEYADARVVDLSQRVGSGRGEDWGRGQLAGQELRRTRRPSKGVQEGPWSFGGQQVSGATWC